MSEFIHLVAKYNAGSNLVNYGDNMYKCICGFETSFKDGFALHLKHCSKYQREKAPQQYSTDSYNLVDSCCSVDLDYSVSNSSYDISNSSSSYDGGGGSFDGGGSSGDW